MDSIPSHSAASLQNILPDMNSAEILWLQFFVAYLGKMLAAYDHTTSKQWTTTSSEFAKMVLPGKFLAEER